jgi:hypothetical protein
VTDDLIDLETYSQEQYAAFFTDLLAHALAGEGEQVESHVREVLPTPANVGLLLMGMCQSISVVADIAHSNHDHGEDEDDAPRVELHFGSVEDAGDRLVVEAGGYPGVEAITPREPESVPPAVRWSGQLTAAAIAQDVDTLFALTETVVDSYVAQYDAGTPMEDIDALRTVPAMIECMVGFATAMSDEVSAAHARLSG